MISHYENYDYDITISVDDLNDEKICYSSYTTDDKWSTWELSGWWYSFRVSRLMNLEVLRLYPSILFFRSLGSRLKYQYEVKDRLIRWICRTIRENLFDERKSRFKKNQTREKQIFDGVRFSLQISTFKRTVDRRERKTSWRSDTLIKIINFRAIFSYNDKCKYWRSFRDQYAYDWIQKSMSVHVFSMIYFYFLCMWFFFRSQICAYEWLKNENDILIWR